MGAGSDSSLMRWIALFLVALCFVVGGTWTTVKFTIDYLLREDATANARDWAQYLAANVNDLEQIAAGEQPSAASMAFFQATRKSGQVFRYLIFNRDGYSQLLMDRDKVALVDLSEFSPDAARAVNSGEPFLAFGEANSSGMPRYYAEAYVPVRIGNHPVAIVAAFVDETNQRATYYKALAVASATLCLLTGLSFGVPAIAWYRRSQEKQKADQHIRFLAHHDGLTELSNRLHFMERLDAALLAVRQPDCGLALHFIDIDHFKMVNDTLGHDGGDFVLKTLAQRLLGIARADDIVARLGGDELVVAQTNVRDKDQAEQFARRVLSALSAPMSFKGQVIVATPSIGIAMSPCDGTTSERLLKSADLAVYDAKASGRNCFRFFAREMHQAMQSRLNPTWAAEGSVRIAG
jgi:diguanylate cyclase (GGDEF)-like protein